MAKLNPRKYHLITFGCQMNKSDSERLAGFLNAAGLSMGSALEAGVIIINTCGVRQSAEDRVYSLIPRLREQNPAAQIVLTGCLSQRSDVQKKLKNQVDIWLPIIDLPRLPKLLGLDFSCFGVNDYLDLKPQYSSNFQAFVPIGNGCNNFCSYCVVPYARGREIYRPPEKIIDEVKSLIKKGYKEITLIAQNVNSYRYDANLQISMRTNELANKNDANLQISMPAYKQANNEVDFPDLLKAIDEIKGDFWIRFATSHPKDMSEKLIKAIAAGRKICEHIHLPAQSGDNKILAAMNRGYTVEHYYNLIAKIRKNISDAAITTDIIVGFPGEGQVEFKNTLKLFKEVKFDLAYIARYSPRPFTAAFQLKDNVSSAEKKKREQQLGQILRQTALANNQAYIGRVVDVLTESLGRDGLVQGKTRTYKNVKIKNLAARQNIIGQFVKVKITAAQDFGLIGKAI